MEWPTTELNYKLQRPLWVSCPLRGSQSFAVSVADTSHMGLNFFFSYVSATAKGLLQPETLRVSHCKHPRHGAQTAERWVTFFCHICSCLSSTKSYSNRWAWNFWDEAKLKQGQRHSRMKQPTLHVQWLQMLRLRTLHRHLQQRSYCSSLLKGELHQSVHQTPGGPLE